MKWPFSPTRIEVAGIYPVQADEPVHMIELIVRNCKVRIECREITQEDPIRPRANWQAPYDEKVFDETGTKLIGDPFNERNRPEWWQGNIRLVFFFHYLDLAKPLKTPFGDIALRAPSERPARLAALVYEPPG
jgi:hypothetical protein